MKESRKTRIALKRYFISREDRLACRRDVFFDEHVDHSPGDGDRLGDARDLAGDVRTFHEQRHVLRERRVSVDIFGMDTGPAAGWIYALKTACPDRHP